MVAPTTASKAPKPPSNPPAAEERDKPRLTDAEKKRNHIASEQKRRHAIRLGFDRLSEIVPGYRGQARSEGLVLNGTAEYIRKLAHERRELLEACDANGVAVDEEMRKAIDSFPWTWIDAMLLEKSVESQTGGSAAEGSEALEGSEPPEESEAAEGG